jgi:hypothetical protein
MTVGRIVLIAVGVVAALIALALTLGGAALVYAHVADRDDDGYYMTGHDLLQTPLYALVSEELDIDESTPGFLLDRVGKVRITASPRTKRTFLGIGRSDDVDRYLGSVPHSRVVDLDFDPFSWSTEEVEGTGQPSGPPGAQGFWAASATGTEEVTVDWEVESGEWVAVAMNADGSRAVDVEVAAGAKAPILLPLGIGLIVVGLLFGVTAFFMFRLSAQRAPPPRPPEPSAA